jgi:hypothetical protein
MRALKHTQYATPWYTASLLPAVATQTKQVRCMRCASGGKCFLPRKPPPATGQGGDDWESYPNSINLLDAPLARPRGSPCLHLLDASRSTAAHCSLTRTSTAACSPLHCNSLCCSPLSHISRCSMHARPTVRTPALQLATAAGSIILPASRSALACSFDYSSPLHLVLLHLALLQLAACSCACILYCNPLHTACSAARVLLY